MSKICTDIEQSKKLIELGIDANTADMYYMWTGSDWMPCLMEDGDYNNLGYIPAWSLSALLELMPERDGRSPELNRPINTNKWWVLYHSTAFLSLLRTKECNTPLDAAFEMICLLLKDKLI